MLANNVLFLTRILAFTLRFFFCLCVFMQQKQQQKRQFTAIGHLNCDIFSLFLLVILLVLYSVKCGQFHFNTSSLSASRHLNKRLHFSLFITRQSFLPSSLQQFQTSVFLHPHLVSVKCSSVLFVIFELQDGGLCQRLRRGKKK